MTVARLNEFIRRVSLFRSQRQIRQQARRDMRIASFLVLLLLLLGTAVRFSLTSIASVTVVETLAYDT
jgi:hypothetical protein